MIYFTLKGNQYSVPGKWDELTDCQFLSLSKLLTLFTEGSISLDDVKVRWLLDMFKIDTTRIAKQKADLMVSNLLKIGDQITFFYRYQWDNNALEGVSKPNKLLLSKYDPFSLPNSPEIIYARRKPYRLTIDTVISVNLMPSIVQDNFTAIGWDPDTITAQQVLSCLDIIDALKKDETLIYHISEILYDCPVKSWSSNMSYEYHNAILLNFQAFVNYVFTHTRFNILFGSPKGTSYSKKMTYNLDRLYSLCKKGYGSAVEIEKLPLMEYLIILTNELYESVRMMKAQKTSVIEISDTTGLTIEEINAL